MTQLADVQAPDRWVTILAIVLPSAVALVSLVVTTAQHWRTSLADLRKLVYADCRAALAEVIELMSKLNHAIDDVARWCDLYGVDAVIQAVVPSEAATPAPGQPPNIPDGVRPAVAMSVLSLVRLPAELSDLYEKKRLLIPPSMAVVIDEYNIRVARGLQPPARGGGPFAPSLDLLSEYLNRVRGEKDRLLREAVARGRKALGVR